jgi:hypothetical protein
MSASFADSHGDEIDRLAAERDWAGLVRYWIAHDYQDALQRALDLVQEASQSLDQKPYHVDLARCLETLLGSLGDEEGLPEILRRFPDGLEDFEDAERRTLQLLYLYLQVQHQLAGVVRNQGSSRAGRDAAQTAEKARSLAEGFEDLPLVARFSVLLGIGQGAAGKLRESARHFTQALGIYQALARRQPEVYGPLHEATRKACGQLHPGGPEPRKPADHTRTIFFILHSVPLLVALLLCALVGWTPEHAGYWIAFAVATVLTMLYHGWYNWKVTDRFRRDYERRRQGPRPPSAE